jgi:excisionase family DNA binding protein
MSHDCIEPFAGQNLGTSAPMNDRLLTAAEVAEKLGVSRRWVEDATRRGDIPHVRLGRFPRYRAETIALWIEGLETRSRRRPVPSRGTK